MNALMTFLAVLITILFVVGTHEYGHFLVARLVGVKVLRFSIGFGKKLFHWHDKKGTEYVFALIPLGGYVKMLDENEGEVTLEERVFAYNRQSVYKRLLIVSAGPLFNFITAFCLYWLLFVIGFTTIVPVVGQTVPQSIAADAGLKPRQEIIQVNDKPTPSWMKVILGIFNYAGEKGELRLQVKSLDQTKTQTVTLNLARWHLDELEPDPLGSLGIIPLTKTGKNWPPELLRKQQFGPLHAMGKALGETHDLIQLNFIMLGKMLTGKVSLQSLGGPITIIESAGAALNSGFITFVSFLAFLSIAVGVINLLPIPGLDGGHAFFQLIEIIIRRPLSLKVQLLFFRVGLILLFLLITQALINDFARL